MSPFILALQFLTVIPISSKVDLTPKTFSHSLLYFPLVGLMLGMFLSIITFVIGVHYFNDFTISCFIVVILAIVTGGLHLDGVADTFDALGSRRSKEDMLAIMRDSRIGAMGVIGLVSVILLKVALLSSLHSPAREAALILMCVVSRFSMVVVMFFFPYARDTGKAKLFVEGKSKRVFIAALATAVLFVFITGFWPGLVFMFITVLLVSRFAGYVVRKIGGITGDVVGTVNELSEILVLFFYVLWGRV